MYKYTRQTQEPKTKPFENFGAKPIRKKRHKIKSYPLLLNAGLRYKKNKEELEGNISITMKWREGRGEKERSCIIPAQSRQNPALVYP